MAQKRSSLVKSSAKTSKTKSSSGNTKRTASKNTRKTAPKRKSYKKSKTKIPAYKMMVYCALGISLCILAYLIADIALKTPTVVDAPSVTERFTEQEKKVQPEKKTEPVKTEKKSETPKAVAETVKKVEPPKTVQKPVTETKPAVSVKTTEPVKPVEKPATETKSAPVTEVKKTEPAASPKKSSFNFPVAKNGATLAFLLDDGGQNLNHLEKFVTLPFPVTVAVLPRIQYSVESAARVRSSGNELMLHQPMQPINGGVNPGPGAITANMNEDEIISTLFYNVNQIGPIAGINNHEGSAITADAEKMAVVMKFTTEEGLYFLDSRTNVETKVPYVAEALGYSYYERNIFLDNEKTRENVLSELNKGLKIANQNGQAIMIAHVWSADFLPEILKEVYPELVSKGYKIVTVSQCSKKY